MFKLLPPVPPRASAVLAYVTVTGQLESAPLSTEKKKYIEAPSASGSLSFLIIYT